MLIVESPMNSGLQTYQQQQNSAVFSLAAIQFLVNVIAFPVSNYETSICATIRLPHQ